LTETRQYNDNSFSQRSGSFAGNLLAANCLSGVSTKNYFSFSVKRRLILFEFTDLHREYQGRVVLDLPTLTLNPTGRYGLFGENGAGKTTLLNLLTTQLQVRLPRGRVGFLPQKPYAFALKVRDSLALGIPEALNLTAAEIEERLTRQLTTFDLTELAGKRADRLSGGESQRLALARLLIVPRQVLLLDEPGNHLDRESLLKMELILRNYLDQNPCLMVLTTHQMNLAEQLVDTVMVLEQGQMVFNGPPQAWQPRT
jgi:ABC-type multidrug transport system ATPase subunit